MTRRERMRNPEPCFGTHCRARWPEHLQTCSVCCVCHERYIAAVAKVDAETPLDRDLREIDEAFANWKLAVRNCRDGEATPEDVKRYALALYDLMAELRDVMPYSENS